MAVEIVVHRKGLCKFYRIALLVGWFKINSYILHHGWNLYYYLRGRIDEDKLWWVIQYV